MMVLRPFSLSLLAVALFALTACAPVKKQLTEEELIEMAKSMPSESDIKERFHANAGLYRQVCQAPELAPYYTKTPCLPRQASAEQLADTSFITEGQSAAARQAIGEINELNAQTRSLMKRSGIDYYAELAQKAADKTDPLIRQNQNQLLAGEITWGEYNRRRIEILDLDPPKSVSEAPSIR